MVSPELQQTTAGPLLRLVVVGLLEERVTRATKINPFIPTVLADVRRGYQPAPKVPSLGRNESDQSFTVHDIVWKQPDLQLPIKRPVSSQASPTPDIVPDRGAPLHTLPNLRPNGRPPLPHRSTAAPFQPDRATSSPPLRTTSPGILSGQRSRHIANSTVIKSPNQHPETAPNTRNDAPLKLHNTDSPGAEPHPLAQR